MSDTAGGDDTTEGNTDAASTPNKDNDADDGGFDKEAERKRLREKYERDQQRRQATEKMSELLLQGATMTNKHCESCGSPIFRHDGEEFCPTCGGTTEVVDETESKETETTRDPTDQPATAADTDRTTPDTGRDGVSGLDTSRTETHTPGRGRSPSPDRSVRSDPGNRQAGQDSAEGLSNRSRGPSGGIDQPTGASEAPSLAQARASLRRAIVSLSEQAAQSDDPVRAKNLLEAANQGAEALSELGGDEV